MTHRLTRDQLLRRGAAGASILTIPGLLAACGGGQQAGRRHDDHGEEAGGHAALLELDVLHRHERQDAGASDAGCVREEVRHPCRVHGGHQRQRHVRRQDLAAALAGAVDRPRHHRHDRQLEVAVAAGRERLAREAGQERDPELQEFEETLRHPGLDLNRDYSLPWQSGMTGIAYNDRLTDPVLTIDDLLENPKLKGKVTALNEMGDTMTLVMLSNGDDPTKVTDASFDRALKRIQKAKDSGQIRQFTGNDYAPPLGRGDLSAAVSWSGDIPQLANPHVHWNLSEAGGNIWTDDILIPTGGDVYTASVFMNYVYDPKVMGLMEASNPKEEHDRHLLHPAGDGAARHAEDQPRRREQSAHLPTKKMLDNAYIFDSAALKNQKYQEEWNNLAF